MEIQSIDSAKVPWIGPAKYKVENLPHGLYNTRERTHLTLTFTESIILLALVMQIDHTDMTNFTGITSKELSSILNNLEDKFNNLMKEHHFDKKGCFSKLSGVSSKDIAIKPVHNFDEFLKITVRSKRIINELYKAIYYKAMQKNNGNISSPLKLPAMTEEDYDPVSIIISEWVNTSKFIEFRTFVIDGKICFISQYNWWEYYSQIEKDPNRVINTIDEIIWDYKSRKWLIDQNIVADFWLDENLKDPKFIEFNPYQLSDPCLFNDKESIYKPELPIEKYRDKQGCFRFIGRIDNGFESIPIDAILNDKMKKDSIKKLEAMKKKLEQKKIDPDYYQGISNALEVQKLRKIKTLGISQAKF